MQNLTNWLCKVGIVLILEVMSVGELVDDKVLQHDSQLWNYIGILWKMRFEAKNDLDQLILLEL